MSAESKILIGYWNDARNTYPHLPKVEDFVDLTWLLYEREAVARYLERGKVVQAWRGFSTCRFCQKMNGSTDLSDVKYQWPAGLSHYVREHGVKPPQDFIEHVLLEVDKSPAEFGIAKSCSACAHSYMEADTPALICGHPDSGTFGIYALAARKGATLSGGRAVGELALHCGTSRAS